MTRERCRASSPYSGGWASLSVKKPCTRMGGHAGRHWNDYWEWDEGDREPRPRTVARASNRRPRRKL